MPLPPVVSHNHPHGVWGALRVDEVSPILRYVGEATLRTENLSESAPVWSIRREMIVGTVLKVDWALNRASTAIWTARTTYFGASPAFANEVSTLFDGANDRVELFTAAALNFERTQAFSWSYWLKSVDIAGTSINIGDRTSATARGWGSGRATGGSGVLTAYFTGTNNTSEVQVSTAAAAIVPGIWKHIVVTYAGTSLASGVAIYVDGVAVATVVDVNNLTTTIVPTMPVTFGASAGGGVFTTGNLDEISIWSKALSAAEVLALRDGTRPANLAVHPAVANLAGWWRMGDFPDGFPTIQDRSGAGNHALMVNMAASAFVADVPT